MSKFKVIAIDDQEDILQVYSMFYEESEYELHTFSKVNEAIAFIENNHKEIAYILSDFSMPEKNGFDLKREINQMNIDIPFIIVTAFYDKGMAIDGMSLGICYFVEKPLINIEFPPSILELIERRKLSMSEERSMITSFIDESSPMLEEIEELILKLENDPTNEGTLNTYYRLLHTIKGTASCVGLTCIPTFVHSYENLVGKLKNKELTINSAIINILLSGLDQVKILYDDARIGIIDYHINEKCTIFDYKESDQIKNNIVKLNSIEVKQIETTNETDKKDSKLNVDIAILDNFMELSGQLTVLRNTILKSANYLNEKYQGDKDVNSLTDALSEMHKVSSSLQTDISEMRKITVENIYKPLKRVVRDAAKGLGKEIQFETFGDELKVDTSIGKVLSNALVHMIRNSIDHGIETSENRLKCGKYKHGNISLSLREDGEFIIVDLKDDGNGLDVNRIKAKAIEKKLYTEEQIKNMSEQKVFSLIFESGFSTAQKVTDISGRGVGMDMVRSAVESVGGKIIIKSTLGSGSQFTIVLPIPRSVLIIKSLMIEINSAIYSIALDDVKEVITLNETEKLKNLQTIGNSFFLKHHDELIPLVDLKGKFIDSNTIDFSSIQSIVIVKSSDHRYGIIVDKIFEIEEIVVKKLSKQLSNSKLFSGVTFIGDSDLALILNLEGIAEIFEISSQSDENEERFINKNNSIESDLVEYMQFNLKSNSHYAIPLKSVYRLENIELSKVEYSGNVALIQYQNSFLPVVLTDHYLNLIPKTTEISSLYPEILNVIVTKVENKLVGLIVNEICDIGISNSKVNSDVSDREGILGTIFINDVTVSILNTNSMIKTQDLKKAA